MPHLSHLCSLFLLAQLSWTWADDWPRWRGPGNDARSGETGLLASWPEGGPEVIWRIENAGVGYSSLAIADGRILTQGDLDGVEHILAFNEADGNLLWAVQPEPVAARLDALVLEQFTRMDRDQSGKLEEAEVLNSLGPRALASDGAEPGAIALIAGERTTRFLSAYDEDGDGQLGLKEIPAALAKELSRIDQATADRGAIGRIAEARTEAALAALDTDQDDRISRKESRGTVMQSLAGNIDQKPAGEKRGDGDLTRAELTDYFGKRDRGRDGTLTATEISAYFAKFHPGRDGILDLADLKRTIGGYRNGQGDGPRGTPTVAGDRVYTEGGNGDVTCLDAATGQTQWHVNLVDDLGGKRPGWGYSESPLVVKSHVIVTPGGADGTVVALHADTGEPAWRSAGLQQGAHYASPLLTEIGGRRQIIQFGRESTFALSADDGKPLWEYDGAANGTANVATPIVAGDHVLASSAYGTGGGLVRITNDPETGQKAEQVWFEKSFANHHGGLVKVDDHVYGFGSSSLFCVNFLTGEIAWQDRSVGKGSIVYADGHLYCLGERHEMALVEANPDACVEKGRFPIPDQGRPSWAHPVVANGRLYIRDQHTLTCYNIKEMRH